MATTLKLRLCVVQFDDDGEPGIFAAGWDTLGEKHNQDDIRRREVMKVAGMSARRITSVRFIEVDVPATETELSLELSV